MRITSILSARWRRNLTLTLGMTCLGAGIGATVSITQALIYETLRWSNVAYGMVDGGFIVLLLATYTFLFVELVAHAWFHRRSFAVVWVLNSLTYAVLIVFGRGLGQYLSGLTETLVLIPPPDSMEYVFWVQSIVVALIASFIVNFLYQNGRLLGQRVLMNFLVGRYHQPRTETRVVLFLDLIGSTSLAERIGDRQYLRFLDRFFMDMSDAILESGAEIYKYVGDEVILTWPVERGLRRADCLRFFERFSTTIRTNAGGYVDEFAAAPRFRAGAHVGTMTVGELGDLKKEIALIGDALNTTARIMDLCKTTGDSLLISGELARALEERPADGTDLRLKPAGEFELRGKKRPMRVYALEAEDTEEAAAVARESERN